MQNLRPGPYVKICCIANLHEARMAIAAGADALGLVSPMPSGPGAISLAQIADIVVHIPPPIATFLLTPLQDAEGIIAQHQISRTNTIQLVDTLPVAELQRLRSALPGIKLVQVVHMTGPESVDEAQVLAPYVDAILLDSGNQKLPIKELGGTGRTHNWSLSRQVVQSVSKPVFLAGGLNAGNVAEAVRAVQPYGLDLCSSVRTDGALDTAKLHTFFAATRAILCAGGANAAL